MKNRMEKITQRLKKVFKEIARPESLEVLLLGNRPSSLIGTYFCGEALKRAIGNEHGAWGLAAYGLAMFLAFSGNTVYSFARTRDHIKRYGEPDKRFLRKAMVLKKNGAMDYYCNIQGVYLACRKYGGLDKFWEVRKDSKNRVPNF